MKALLDETTSVVCVRHPLARVASVYFQKLIDLGHKSWKGLTRDIIAKYRQAGAVVGSGNKSDSGDDGARNKTFVFPGDDPAYVR